VEEKNTLLFHRLFLDEVMKRGRVFEGGLMTRYMLGPARPLARRPSKTPSWAGRCSKRAAWSFCPRASRTGLFKGLFKGKEGRHEKVSYYPGCSLEATARDYPGACARR
jgi:hypothetical protein